MTTQTQTNISSELEALRKRIAQLEKRVTRLEEERDEARQNAVVQAMAQIIQMMTEQQIKEEIAAVLDMMRTAHESQREYMIGQLSALLWVQGEVMRPTAFQLACEAWDAMRKEAQP